MSSSQSNREFEFLCGCLLRFLNPEAPLPDVAQLDWAALIELAREHLVLPLLAWVLDEPGAVPPEVLPPEVMGRVQQSFQSTARSNLTLSSELLRLLGAFESAGIRVVPLKGPTLAQHLYGDITLRSFSDLDVLIQPADVLRTKSLLEARGYRLTSSLHWNSERAVLRSRDSQLAFTEPERRIAVDLHWRLMPKYYPAAIETRQVWSELRTLSFAGGTVPALRAEPLLRFLSAHAARHHWERLGWICDIACLIRSENNLNWEYVLRESDGTARMTSVSLLLAQGLLGAKLPERVSRRIAADPGAASLAQEIHARLERRTPGTISALESAQFAWRLFERRKALGAIAGIFFAPTEAEFRVLQLPSPLYGLYYPFRLLRILSKYAARALRLGSAE